ncbi:MAG TPA: winged helix-turn-helix transcriptional regulator [Solirubrobacteraceae bacterium]|nr:winged helix-turn-helix transcriptional regulator [Solirubrobacteraceae bacterium]
MSSNAEPIEPGGPRVCSIADALNVVGDRWSLLILRELSFGVSRFADIRVNTGAPAGDADRPAAQVGGLRPDRTSPIQRTPAAR